MKRQISALIFLLLFFTAACSSLEKRHSFIVDRKDPANQALLCNPEKNNYDILVIGDHHFFIEDKQAPFWGGPPLIPFIPESFTTNISEIVLTFRKNIPTNLDEWKIKFDSDGFTTSLKVNEKIPHYAFFEFPKRKASESFTLIIPTADKPINIHYTVESTPWKYRPLFIYFFDRFPFFNCYK